MSNQFEALAKAKPTALYKLVSKLPLEESAIVLTHLPDALAFQVIAFYPEAEQDTLGPAMVEARWVEPERVNQAAASVKSLLAEARKTLAAKAGTGVHPAQAAPTPPAATPPAKPITKTPAPPPQASPASAHPVASRANSGIPLTRKPPSIPPRPATPAPGVAARSANPYQAAAEAAGGRPVAPQSFAAQQPAQPSAPPPPEKASLTARAREITKEVMKSAFAPAREKPAAAAPRAPAAAQEKSAAKPVDKVVDKNAGKPQRWIPRQATSSPINGPALPGKPPPIAGDPFTSPLAKAGLLDLIGRAQETLLPKDTFAAPSKPAPRPPAKPPVTLKLGKNGKPEPEEGVMRRPVEISKTPRVLGPANGRARARDAEDDAPPAGARRMDGKAILAAILREAGPDVRNTVQDDDPKLFKQLRDRMFYFDDLIYTEDNALARVFTAAPADVSALALKFAAPTLRDRVMRVVSPGRARALKDSASTRAGMDDIERAQKKVLDVALQLQAAGRILIDPRDPDLAGE